MTVLDDGRYTAVVDAIEDGLARVFFERDGDEVSSEVLDASVLPEEGRHADAILSVIVVDGTITDWSYEPETTEGRKQAAQDRFDRLSSRPPSEEEPDEDDGSRES